MSRQNSLKRIPLCEPDLRGNEEKYLRACIADNWISSAGHFIGEFEAMIAARCGTRNAVALCNGTVAIKMALLACGVREGDRVIVPDWTFIASANAISDAGATPIFVDVAADTWGIDPELVGRALSDFPDVKAIVAVHPLGYACDFAALSAVAGDRPIIEDAAGAMGALYGGRPLGGLGRFGCVSFNGNKMVSAGAGGAVVTDDDDAAKWIRHVTAQSRVDSEYRHDQVGYNYRMSNLNAAVGKAQMERFDEIMHRKRFFAERYRAVISSAARARVKAMPDPQWGRGNNWLFSILCENETHAAEFVRHMDLRAIECRKFWRAISDQPAYQGSIIFSNHVSQDLSGRVVSLPCGTGMKDHEFERVLLALEEFLAL